MAPETSENKSKSTTLKITGMTCAACSARIEKGLSKMPGVEKASVNFAAEKAGITYDPTQVRLKELAAKVADLGYQVITDRAEFKISGMSCAACSARIEKGLNTMPGVYNATVNLAAERATVEYNAQELSLRQIQDKVKKLGYEAHNLSDAGEVDREKTVRQEEIRSQRLRLIL